MPVLSADANHILIASDAWGTRTLLEHCRPLSHAQFHRRFEIGPGSIHDTITHVISATRRWTDRLAGRAPRPMLHALPGRPNLVTEAKERSVDELIALVNDAERDLYTIIKPDPQWLASAVPFEWTADDGSVKLYEFSRAAVIVHLTTHGYHHRAQVLNMLRHLGIPGTSDKLPEPSAVDWQTVTESPPTIRPAAPTA